MSSGFLSTKPELLDWLAQAHASVIWDSSDFFRIGDVEVEHQVRVEPASISVRRLVRGEDQGLEFCADRWVDVEKYLTFVYGGSVRYRHKLPRLLLFPIPFDLKYLRPGFSLTGIRPDRVLKWSDDDGDHEVRCIDDIDAVEFSLYEVLPLVRLREILLGASATPEIGVGAPESR